MLESVALTDIGIKRILNQDHIYSTREKIGNLPNVFIVADGMGGHNGGELASKWSVEIIADEISKNGIKDTRKILNQAIQTANKKIRSEARENPDLYGMGTTIVVATVIDKGLFVANAGDSRLYIADPSAKTLRQVTKDHSLVEEMVRMGGMEKEAAKYHPDRHIITRAIGAKERLQVDFFYEELKTGEIILMCSDGLSNMLGDDEIGIILYTDKTIEQKAKELIKAANENGGKDNIAVILVKP